MSDVWFTLGILYGIGIVFCLILWITETITEYRSWQKARWRYPAHARRSALSFVMVLASIIFIPLWPIAVAVMAVTWAWDVVAELIEDLREKR